MKRRLIKAIKGESGQALPIVLILLGLGGLLIAPSLNYASTSLNAGQIVEKNINGLYAADAGIEDALWSLKNSVSPHTQLNVNQMQVVIEEPDYKGTYTLYRGKLEVIGHHYYYLAVDGEMEWIPEEEAYQYTITVTWQAEPGSPKIHLEEVGVRLPVGYSYQPGSADSFGGNLSTNEPDDPVEQDQAGAYMLNWELGSYPYVWDPEPIQRTQMFYVTGEGGLEGDYTWVGTHGVTPIGKVGEVIGALYKITATATQDGDTTAKVVADAMVYETEGEIEIRVILWQINPQQ